MTTDLRDRLVHEFERLPVGGHGFDPAALERRAKRFRARRQVLVAAAGVLGAAAVGLLIVMLLPLGADAPQRVAAAPGRAVEIDCGARTVDPGVVEVRPDGVHVILRMPKEVDVIVQDAHATRFHVRADDGSGVLLDREILLPLAPGEARIICGAPKQVEPVRMRVVDPHELWAAPRLACTSGVAEFSTLIGRGVGPDPLTAAIAEFRTRGILRHSDVLFEEFGTSPWRIGILRGGQAVVIAEFTQAPEGGWGVSYLESCPS